MLYALITPLSAGLALSAGVSHSAAGLPRFGSAPIRMADVFDQEA